MSMKGVEGDRNIRRNKMSISKRNGKYYCRFQLNKERHHYLCNGATTKKEAEQIENAFKYKLQQQQNGVIEREEKGITLKAVEEMYIEYAKANYKNINKMKYHLKIINKYFNISDNIQKMKPKDIEEFRNKLKIDRKVKNSTINRVVMVLSKIFTIALKNDLIKEHPVHKVKRLKENNLRIRFLTIEEENRLMKELEEPMLSIVITALQTGMRRGEIVNLKWSDIDRKMSYIELLETKSGRSRKIPISEKLRKILKKQPKINDYVFQEEVRAEWIFQSIWKLALKKAGIENLRFHDLRHTAATRMVEKGIDLVVVKEILGHSTIETTMKYAHAVPERKLRAIEILNSYN